ncbi:tau 95 subunit of transcription factor TFIIIC [Diatrype stigma]|uniref:Tau 95 subunit of transcription factor TFIIIC n=1 Tax=Diatrype stigma TaxID=117547 RepID=A0AAN9UQL9_9PEZI
METISTGPDSDAVAPKLELSSRKIVAIEHPCVILNLDKGLALFGPDPHFNNLLSDGLERNTLPIWFRRDNPTTKPIISQHASSNGILLKITVPKRTGRKRKRGSGEPFSGDVHVTDAAPETGLVNQVSSIARQDAPRSILRKMQDNIGAYQAEAVGMVKDTFRYRGLADFQFATTNSPFLTKVAEHLLPLELSKIRDFKLQTGVDYSRNQEFIPPPRFSDKIVSFNYNYEQNPYVRTQGRNEAGEVLLINTQGRKKMSYGWFVQHDTFPVPTGPRKMHDESHESLNSLVGKVRKAMDERPIWTRRGLMNHLGGNFLESQLRIAIQIAGYQFKGGPWRDAIIKYGVDPRSDPKYRMYQTMSFKLVKNKVGHMNVSWQTIRKGQMQAYAEKNRERNYKSHFWDGESYTTDGKFWQICDITDPFLVDLIQRTPLRPKCDLDDSGWFYRGFWAKVKLIMKAKMLAIKYGRVGSDSDPVPKDGFIYNAYLMQKLSHIRDDSDEKVVMNVHPLTAPMKDLLNDKSARRRPTRIAEMQAGGKKQKDGKSVKQDTVEAGGSDTGEAPTTADVGEPIEWDEDDFTGSDGTESDESEDADSAGDDWEDELEGENAVVENLDGPAGEVGDDDEDEDMNGETEQGRTKGNILNSAKADGVRSPQAEDTQAEDTGREAKASDAT